MNSKLLAVIVALLFIVACGTTYLAYNNYQLESIKKSSEAQDKAEKEKTTISKDTEQQEEEDTVGFEIAGDEVKKAKNIPAVQEKAILASFDEYIRAFNEKDLERYKNIISKNAEGFNYEDDIQSVTEVFKQYNINRTANNVTIVKYQEEEAQVFSNLKTETKKIKTGDELAADGRQVTVFVKEDEDWKVSSIYYIEVDTSDVDTSYDSDNTSNTNSPYTEDELNNDPSAPSTNPNDYNSNGEYVPENGPSDNPADYSFDGEYKPIEDMTEEEKRAELESFFNSIGE